MILEALLGLPEELITGLLILSIVLAVVLAFKVMEMVFETVTIAALSGVFYTAMTFLFETPFAFNDLLLFSFLGASLYMLYGFLMTAFTTAETLVSIPVKIFMSIYRPTRKYLGKGYRALKRKIERMNEEEIEEKDSGEKSTKEVILND
jgi:hypothetical protein